MQIEDVNFFKWHPAIAGDKLAAGSTELSVFSPIISPMYADESIESETSAIEIKTIPSNGGDECAGFLEISSCVVAQYIGRSNITPPCIHKGETVLLSPSINGVYYWKEIGINDDYRLTEDLSLRVANKKITVEELTEENTYSLTLDSTVKHITIRTSKLLPAELIYTIKLDVAGSNAYLADSDGNSILIDSKVPNIRLCNKHQTFMEANDKNVNINAPGSINLKAGTLVKIETPATHLISNVNVLDGVDLAVNTTQSTVITAPIVGVNGQLNVTTGVVSNVIAGGVVSCGASASPITPCTVSDTDESGTGSGAATPALPSNPSDAAVSYNKLVTIATNLTNALTLLQQAIAANESAHTGITTAPAPATPALLTQSAAQVSSALTSLQTAAIANVKGESGAL